MDSPAKNDKLLQEDHLENGSDGIPEDIWEDIRKNEKFIYFGLMFLNGSVLWAYYSGLSAQNFYAVQFKDSKYDFSFLTTLAFSWPMVAGHLIQVIFGIDKKFSQSVRVHAGYVVFIIAAILIMVFSAIDFSSDEDKGKSRQALLAKGIEWSSSGQNTGALLVLMCFGLIGFANSLSEATYYTLAALFPVEKFTNAVQIGNVCAGVFNITVATLIRLAVGGVKQTKDSTELSFYLFFGLLIIVLIAAIFVYRRLMNLPCIRFLIERNDAATVEKDLALNPAQTIANLVRIFKVIWVPAIAQFLIFFVSLAVFPGFGCTGGRAIDPRLGYTDKVYDTTGFWYCSPGIIASYNYGDFIGRIICTAAVYKIFTMNISFVLTILRFAYIPIMLAGVAGTSLYAFGEHIETAMAWNICWNLTIGITTGLLSTVTMGVAPRLVKPEDRESAGAVMVFFLFLGIAAGAHFGYLVGENGWLGLVKTSQLLAEAAAKAGTLAL